MMEKLYGEWNVTFKNGGIVTRTPLGLYMFFLDRAHTMEELEKMVAEHDIDRRRPLPKANQKAKAVSA